MANLFKKSVKYQLNISISYIVLKKPGTAVDRDTVVGVAIERGSKLVTSSEKEVVINAAKDGVVQLNDTVSVEATMYPIGDASNHKFEEKTAKLLIRKHKKSKGGLGGLIGGSATTPQVIGQIVFKLHELLQEEMPIIRKQLIENCPSFPGSSLEYSVDFRTVEEVHSRPLRSMTYHTPEDDLTPPPLPLPAKEDLPVRSDSSNSLNLSSSSAKTGGVAPSDGNKNISKSKIIPYTSPKKTAAKTVSTSKDSNDDDIVEELDPFKYSPSPFSDAGREVKEASFDLSKDSHSPLQGESLLQSSSIIEEDDVFSAAVDFGKVADFDPFGDAALHANQIEPEGRARDDSIFTDWTKESNSPVNPSPPVPNVPQVQQVKSPITTQTPPKSAQRTPPPKPAFLTPTKSATKPAENKQAVAAVAAVSLPVAVNNQAAVEPNINDIDFIKGVVVQQEEKLQQANQLIQFQATTITQLQQRVTQLEEQNRSQEEQVAKAKDYILYQQKMMNSCEEEMLLLKQNMMEAEKNIEQIILSVIASNEEEGEDNQLKEMMVKQSREEIEQAEENILGLIQQVKQLYQQLQKKELQLIQKQQQLNDEHRSNYTTPSKTKTSNGSSAGKNSPLKTPTSKNKGSAYNRQSSDEKDKSRLKLNKDAVPLSPPLSTPVASDFDLSEEIEELKSHYEAKIVELEQTIQDQENQLQQAKEYIAFQETLNANNLNDSELSDNFNAEEYEEKIQELTLTVQFQQDQLAKAKEQLLAQETSSKNGKGVVVPSSSSNSDEEMKKKFESEKAEMMKKILDLVKSIESLEHQLQLSNSRIQELEKQKSPMMQNQSQGTGIDKIKKEYEEKISELQKKIVAQNEQMTQAQEYIAYQESIIASHQDSSQYEEKIVELEKKLKTYEEQLHDYEVAKQSDEKKVKDLTDLIKKQEQQFGQVTKDLKESLRQDTSSRKSNGFLTNQTVNNEKDDLTHSILGLELLLQNLLSQRESLETEKQQLLEDQGSKNQEIRNLQKKLSELTEQLTKQSNKVPDQFDKVKEFQRIKATYEQKMEELNKAIKSQSEQLQNAKELIASQEKKLVSDKEEADALLREEKEKVAKLEEEIGELSNRLDKVSKETEYMTALVGSWDVKDTEEPGIPLSPPAKTVSTKEPNEETKKLQSQLAQVQQEKHELEEMIEQINFAIKAQEDQINQAKEYIAYQETALATSQEESERVLKEEQEKLSKLEEETNQLRSKFDESNAAIVEANRKLEEAIKEKAELIRKIQKLEKSASVDSTPVKSAKDEVQRLQSLNERLGEQLDAVEAEKDELQGCFNQIQSHVVMLGKEIQDLHSSLLPEKKTGDSASLPSTGSISYEELSKYLTSLVVTWRELKVTIVTEREKSSSKSLANVAKETAEKLRIAQETIRKQSKEIDEFENDKQELEDKIAELNSTLKSYEDEINKSKEYIAYQESLLESSHTESEAALVDERQKVSQLQEEIGKLTKQLDEAKASTQSAQSNTQELEKRLAVSEASQAELKNSHTQLQNYSLMIGKEIQDLYATYLPDRQSAVSKIALPAGTSSISQEVIAKYFMALMGSWNELKAAIIAEHSKASSKAEQEAASSKETAEKLRKALAFVEDLKEQITELEAEKKEYEEQVAELKSLEDQMNQAKEYIAYQESTMTSMQEESESALKEERDKVSKLEEEISELSYQVDNLTKAVNNLEKEKVQLIQQNEAAAKRRDSNSPAKVSPKEEEYYRLQSLNERLAEHLEELQGEHDEMRNSLHQVQISVLLIGREIQDLYSHYLPDRKSAISKLPASITTTPLSNTSSDATLADEVFSQYLKALTSSWGELKASITSSYPVEKAGGSKTATSPNIKNNQELENKLRQAEEKIQHQSMQIESLEQENNDFTRTIAQQLDQLKALEAQAKVTTATVASPQKTFTNAQASISSELFQKIQLTLLLFFKEIQELYIIYLPDRRSQMASLKLSSASSVTPEVVAEYLGVVVMSWKDLKGMITAEHQQLQLKDREYQEVVNQLIETKLQVAILTTDIDVQKKKANDLRKEYQRKFDA